MATPPLRFFRGFVLRSFADFRTSPSDEYLAKIAVHHANVMAERFWHYYKDRDPGKVYSAASPSAYREMLAEDECADFALIRDVDDGFKHVELDRKSRRVSSADQTGYELTFLDQSYLDRARLDGQIVVRSDDGIRCDLLSALGSVVAMWERLLA
jgi:hypothetical protein